MKTLTIGYFAGEFGWHLMRWQGIVRHHVQCNKYDKIIIGCEPQYRFLYEDYATDFVNYPEEIKERNMWYANGITISLLPEKNGISIEPNRKICMDNKI